MITQSWNEQPGSFQQRREGHHSTKHDPPPKEGLWSLQPRNHPLNVATASTGQWLGRSWRRSSLPEKTKDNSRVLQGLPRNCFLRRAVSASYLRLPRPGCHGVQPLHPTVLYARNMSKPNATAYSRLASASMRAQAVAPGPRRGRLGRNGVAMSPTQRGPQDRGSATSQVR